MAWTFENTEAGYNKLWKAAQLKASEANQAELFANRIIAAEARYKGVQSSVGVPWFFIGALHMRESSCNFAGVLHNGEHIIGTGRVTTLVPAGRGPFSTWEAAAVDALKMKDMHRVQEWSAARMLYQAEVFNGLGYVGKGINSPYVWGGTTNEQRGKYVADHVFDPNAEDTQLGVAAVLIRLAQKRPDIATVLYPPAEPQEQPQMTDPVVSTPGTSNPGPTLSINNEALAQALLQLVLPLLISALTQGKGLQFPALPPPVAAPPPPPAPTSGTSMPDFITGLLGLLGAAGGQAAGVVDVTSGGGLLAAAVPAVLGMAGLGGVSIIPRLISGVLGLFGAQLTRTK
jgi:lysozyme family protein